LPDEAAAYVARQVSVPASDLGFYEWDGRMVEYHRARGAARRAGGQASSRTSSAPICSARTTRAAAVPPRAAAAGMDDDRPAPPRAYLHQRAFRTGTRPGRSDSQAVNMRFMPLCQHNGMRLGG